MYLSGVANVFDSEWKGSAEDYVPGHPEAKYLTKRPAHNSSNDDGRRFKLPASSSQAIASEFLKPFIFKAEDVFDLRVQHPRDPVGQPQ